MIREGCFVFYCAASQLHLDSSDMYMYVCVFVCLSVWTCICVLGVFVWISCVTLSRRGVGKGSVFHVGGRGSGYIVLRSSATNVTSE